MARGATVYRLYGHSGVLLYVGCTTNLASRLGNHDFDKPWFGDVAFITVQHFADKRTALASEREALRVEHPVHSITIEETGRRAIAGLKRWRESRAI